MRQSTLNTTAVWDIAHGLGIDSIAELARLADIERSYLSRVLGGQRPAKPSHVTKLARALRVAPVAILGPVDPAAALAEVERGDAEEDERDEANEVAVG